jgi:hypothetical protein
MVQGPFRPQGGKTLNIDNIIQWVGPDDDGVGMEGGALEGTSQPESIARNAVNTPRAIEPGRLRFALVQFHAGAASFTQQPHHATGFMGFLGGQKPGGDPRFNRTQSRPHPLQVVVFSILIHQFHIGETHWVLPFEVWGCLYPKAKCIPEFKFLPMPCLQQVNRIRAPCRLPWSRQNLTQSVIFSSLFYNNDGYANGIGNGMLSG